MGALSPEALSVSEVSEPPHAAANRDSVRAKPAAANNLVRRRWRRSRVLTPPMLPLTTQKMDSDSNQADLANYSPMRRYGAVCSTQVGMSGSLGHGNWNTSSVTTSGAPYLLGPKVAGSWCWMSTEPIFLKAL